MKKNITRLKRIYYKNNIPYIKFKNKFYSVEGNDIKQIIKLIKKLQKKYKIKKYNKDKIDEKKNKIKNITDGITRTYISTSDISNIQRDLYDTKKELENKINIENNDIKAIEYKIDKIKNEYEDKILELNKNKQIKFEGKIYNDVNDFKNDFYIARNEYIRLLNENINEKEKYKALYEGINKDEKKLKEETNIQMKQINEEIKTKQRGVKEGTKRGVYNTKKKIEEQQKKINEQLEKERIKKLKKEEKIKIKEENEKLINEIDEKIINLEGEGKKIKGGLYDYQIDEIMKNIKYYIKTISYDELPEMINNIIKNKIYKGSFIMNLSKRDDKKGYHHWISIYWDVDENDKNSIMSVCYYDSYGEKPNDYIDKYLKKMIDGLDISYYVKYKYNLVENQKNSNLCGVFAISFILRMLSGLEFKDATDYNIMNDKNMDDKLKQYNKFQFI